MIVKVHAHERVLIIDAELNVEHEDWVPIGLGKIGCVLINTRDHLGISMEALELLRGLKRSNDSLGDVDWFLSDKGWCFSWLGGPNSIKHVDRCESSRTHEVPGPSEYTLIDNDPPIEAVEAIQYAP